jgi:hypothetical protein
MENVRTLFDVLFDVLFVALLEPSLMPSCSNPKPSFF